MLDHARRLMDLFGEQTGMRQMRKWTGWYTKGFRGSARVRGALQRVSSVEELERHLAQLDAGEPFPIHALRTARGKGKRRQGALHACAMSIAKIPPCPLGAI